MANKQENNHTPQVSITKKISVYPKTIHPPKQINLSNLDRQCPLLMYMVFFYKPCVEFSNITIGSVFSSFKKGLEETLSVWYPAAGRLKYSNSNGDGLKKLDLWCDNDGAVLVEAVTEAKICELGDLSEYNEFYEKLVFKPKFNGDFSDMPLLVSQVTRFSCGGYSIGIGASHSLFDGPATFNFLRAWSQNTKMRQNVALVIDQPVHERGTLLLYKPKFSVTKMAAAIEHLYKLIQQKMTNINNDHHKLGECSNVYQEKKIDYVFKTFHISEAMMERLKKIFLHEGSFSCSSFEFLAAHLWKVRTKALAIKKTKMVCLQFAVDIRNKVAPPLPKGFSGNAYVLASIALTAGELEQEKYESLLHRIKDAKTSITNEYVHSYVNALEAPTANLPSLDELTLVSDWTRMPFHEINFFNGQAPYAAPVLPPVPQVAYFMQNGDETRGVDVRIGLLPENMTTFSRYFVAASE